MTSHIFSAVLAFLVFASAQAETHRFEPTVFHNTFSFAHSPVLTIKPGDRVITKTIDARGFDADGKEVGRRSNPETGPFYIEGAEPGDVLVVRIEKIETNRATGWSSSLVAPYTVDPASLRLPPDQHSQYQWMAPDQILLHPDVHPYTKAYFELT